MGDIFDSAEVKKRKRIDSLSAPAWRQISFSPQNGDPPQPQRNDSTRFNRAAFLAGMTQAATTISATNETAMPMVNGSVVLTP